MVGAVENRQSLMMEKDKMPRFAAGVVRFQNEVYPEKKELFEKLATGQSPEALFITCSDSRIETAMITQTEPGDLFIVRNAGNIVPPHTIQTGGTTASISLRKVLISRRSWLLLTTNLS